MKPGPAADLLKVLDVKVRGGEPPHVRRQRDSDKMDQRRLQPISARVVAAAAEWEAATARARAMFGAAAERLISVADQLASASGVPISVAVDDLLSQWAAQPPRPTPGLHVTREQVDRALQEARRREDHP